MTHDAIPLVLLTKCKISPPPSAEELINALVVYPKASSILEAQYLLQVDSWFKQTGNIIACNQQIHKLFEWNAKHLENRDDTRGYVDGTRR